MAHRLFQTGYRLLYSNIFGNVYLEIYSIDLFPKTLENMPRTIKSGRHSVGKSLTFTGNKSYIFFGLPFVMQELLQTSKPESCFGFCSYQKICTVVFSNGLAQILQHSFAPRSLCIPYLSAGTDVW